MKVRKKGYSILLALTLIFTLAAVSTVIPYENVEKVSMLGYKASCSFAPISTLLCIAFAGATCFIRKRFFISFK